MNSMAATDFSRHALFRERRLLRDALLARFFNDGFEEVETPALLAHGTCEPNIEPVRAELADGLGRSALGFLAPSPEFSHKKLLAAGLDKIFEFARVFRNAERFDSPHHNAEFTMLEWYRVGADWSAVMRDAGDLLAAGADAIGADGCRRLGLSASSPETIPMSDAFRRWAGVDLASTPFEDLPRIAANKGLSADAGVEDAFFLILLNEVEPRLADLPHPVLLTRYPAFQSAFARLCSDDARFAERFELYWGGVELANGYGELTDAAQLRVRLEEGAAARRRAGKENQAIDEAFLQACAALPDCAGCALGFDRLFMLLRGSRTLDDVLPFRIPALFRSLAGPGPRGSV